MIQLLDKKVYKSCKCEECRITRELLDYQQSAADIWDDIMNDPEFASSYDPVGKYDQIMASMGTAMGSFIRGKMEEESFARKILKPSPVFFEASTVGTPADKTMLNPGEVYVLGTPKYVGAITESKPLEVKKAS